MRSLLAQIGGQPLLLWIADHLPPARQKIIDLTLRPTLIDAEMIAAISVHAGGVIHSVPSSEARAMGLEGMVFERTELPIAASLPGPYVHREVCNILMPHIERALGGRKAGLRLI